MYQYCTVFSTLTDVKKVRKTGAFQEYERCVTYYYDTSVCQCTLICMKKSIVQHIYIEHIPTAPEGSPKEKGRCPFSLFMERTDKGGTVPGKYALHQSFDAVHNPDGKAL